MSILTLIISGKTGKIVAILCHFFLVFANSYIDGSKTEEYIGGLLKKGLNNDEEAFREIYKYYSKSLSSYVFNKTSNWGITQEIVQDSFLALLEGQYSADKGTLHNYLFKIASNLIVSEYRKKPTFQVPLETAVDVTVNDKDPYETLEAKESRLQLQKAIQSLDDISIQIYALKEEGKSLEEIGEVLGLTLDAVKTRWKRAIQTLREVIKK